ncbi:MAG: hypothetical protein J0L67_20195 [Cytophagales bacterium]|nr:hypothetical protein [Cytophagales bacterium]
MAGLCAMGRWLMMGKILSCEGDNLMGGAIGRGSFLGAGSAAFLSTGLTTSFFGAALGATLGATFLATTFLGATFLAGAFLATFLAFTAVFALAAGLALAAFLAGLAGFFFDLAIKQSVLRVLKKDGQKYGYGLKQKTMKP